MHDVDDHDRERTLAFRLEAHGLNRRVRSLHEAAAEIGVQDSPPGTAVLALHARVEGLRPGDVERAIEEERTLLAVYNARSAVSVLPVRDAPVFLAGQRHPMPEWEEGLPAVRDALDGRRLSRDALHQALRERLPPELLPWCEGCRSFHAKRWLLVAACLSGDMCLAGREGRQPAFARPVDWLGAPLPDAPGAPAELVRRYRRRYAPSTARHFAEWAGLPPAVARAAWEAAGDEPPDGLDSPPPPRGVRLLPSGDPFLLARDRELLIADPAVRRRVWTAIGGPGVVIADGRAVALWRARKKGTRLEVAVEPLERLRPAVRDAIAAEAEAIAPLRGCRTALIALSA